MMMAFRGVGGFCRLGGAPGCPFPGGLVAFAEDPEDPGDDDDLSDTIRVRQFMWSDGVVGDGRG
jgi:hypothetical protein